MGWSDRIGRTGARISARLAISAAGVITLGLAGLGEARAKASEPRRVHASSPVLGLRLKEPAQISLNLREILENVFQYIQVSTISDAEEVEIGQEINQMLLNRQYQRYNNSQVQNYVDQIGQRLVAASDDRRDIPYTFQVVVSDAVNAFATPGGYIYVTTGLLRAADNEAQLASVLAHEIGHINERHNIKALRQAVLAQGIAETANIETSTLAQLGYQLAISLPQSREYEYEADARGLRILQAAGYPSVAFVNFLNQLMEASVPPEFLRTHPTSVNRIREIRALIGTETGTRDRGTSAANYESMIYPLSSR